MWKRKIKEPVIKCAACKGKGHIRVSLMPHPGQARNAPQNSRLVQKWVRCTACGGQGEFK